MYIMYIILVQRFELQGGRFTNFPYYYYYSVHLSGFVQKISFQQLNVL